MRHVTFVLILALAAIAGATEPVIPQPHEFEFRRESPRRDLGAAAYYGSVGVLAVSQFADHHSSQNGGYELNPLLRGANGQYSSTKGTLMKAGVVGGIVAVQHWDIRKRPQHRKVWTIFNYGLATVGFVIAAKNSRGGW